MKSPLRFGSRKDDPPGHAPPPVGEVDAWAKLRGPTPHAPPAAGIATAAADAPPDAAAAGPAAPERRRPDLPARLGPRRSLAGEPVAYAGPNRIAAYRDIHVLDRLGRLDEPHRLRLHMPVQGAPPAPLFDVPSVPERILVTHRTRLPAPPTEIYAVPGHELGAFGLLQQQGRVWVNDAVQPPYINDSVQPDTLAMPGIWTGSLLDPAAEIVEVDTPVGVALHPNMVYGHFLLEMLPRLLLLARLRSFGCAFPLAVPSDAPEWTRRFVALLFEDSEIVLYHSKRQRLRAPCFILPSRLNDDYHFHPEMNAAIEALLGRVVGPMLPMPRPPALVYLSRRRYGGWHGIANEAEVEYTLAGLGFATVHPQELSFPEQFALYAGADCIVSNFNSAAHNALFAPRGAAVACIDWLNRCQSGIAALRGQPLAYLPPDGVAFPEPTEHRPGEKLLPTVDCAALVRRLSAFQSFAAAQRGARKG